MKSKLKMLAAALAGVLAIPVFFAVLGYFAQSATNYHVDKVTEPKYRLMCWLPNGTLFYYGFAYDIDQNCKFFSFVPAEGPQAGHWISTTTACTWMELK